MSLVEQIFQNQKQVKNRSGEHTEETPYQCNMCEKKFKLKKRLNEHVNSFHIVHECSECNAQNTKYTYLRNIQTVKAIGMLTFMSEITAIKHF